MMFVMFEVFVLKSEDQVDHLIGAEASCCVVTSVSKTTAHYILSREFL